MPSSRTVVITRPRAQAEDLARMLSARGRPIVVFPLLEIGQLPDQRELKTVLADLSSFALVAFVSPNAIDAAFAHLSGWPAEVAIAVVGEGSRKALTKHGVDESKTVIFMPRNPERADSESLLEALDIESLRGRKVLIVRGDGGRELLADALHAAGCLVTQVTAYRRSMPVLDPAARQRLLELIGRENDWIVTSSEALRNLVKMAADSAGEAGVAKLQRQQLCVSHNRVAEIAHQLGFINITHIGTGDERILAALQSRHE